MLKQWVPLWTIPVIIVFSIGTVWLRLAIIRTTYAINQTDREIDRSRQDREMMQIKVAALRSPRRLEVLARTKFGLSQPKMEQVVHIQKADLRHEP